MARERRYLERFERLIIYAVALGALAWGVGIVFTQNWRQAKGYEYEWIAGSLASGNGYSLPCNAAWLGPYESPNGYSPTAWSEPLHTAIMALFMRVFGDYARLFLVLLNIVWLGLACLTICRVGRTLSGGLAGYVSVILFLAVIGAKSEQVTYIGNASLACLLVSLCAMTLLELLDGSSTRKLVGLGLILGLTLLAHAGSLLFAPLAVFMIVAQNGRLKEVCRDVAILLMTVLIVVSPWVLRNYVTFDQLVPVRNGFGWQLYLGNLGLSVAVGQNLGTGSEWSSAPWLANSTSEALVHFRFGEYEAAIRNYLHKQTEDYLPESYASSNEAQRDRFYLRKALAFMLERPAHTIVLAFWKSIAFLDWGISTTVLTLLAFAGWLVGLRNLRVNAVMLMILAYAVPFVLSIPLYYRYRFTIEPLMAVLGAVFISSVVGLQTKALLSAGTVSRAVARDRAAM